MALRARFIQHKRQILLSLAMVSLIVAIVSNYLDDQQTAARMLANKVSLPSATFLQAFEQSRHLNLLRETQVIGEIDLNRTATANLGSSDNPHWIELVPIFGVSSDGAPMAKARILDGLSLDRRPMPRGLKNPVSADGTPYPLSREHLLARIPTVENAPALAVMVRSVEPDDATFTSFEALGAKQLGGGANGALVELSGALLSEGSALAGAARATLGKTSPGLSDEGVYFAPIFDVRAGEATLLYQRIFHISLNLAVFLSLLALTPSLRRAPRKTMEKAPDYVRAAGRLPSIQVFQPIRTQYELEVESNAANSDTAPGALTKLNAILCRAVRNATWIRSPR